MNIIVAVDENWAIGKNGQLLAHLPGDLKYYKEKTLGTNIVLGRKTLDSFPGGKPLPKRQNIVLTRSEGADIVEKGCKVVHSVDELLKLLETIGGEVFVSGGDSIYKQLLPYCDTFYITHIQKVFDGADAFFPDITAIDGIKETWRSEEHEENGIKYYFTKYER